MRNRKRAGFTLFQLLLILAVLLILLGLLLPAVQKVRDAAARVQSTNNLKQLALATHNYNDTYNKMPPGVDSNRYSMLFQLLPFIEQAALYNKADRAKAMDDKENATVREMRVTVFESPRDPDTQPNPKWGPTSYMGNAGTKASLEDNNGIFYKNSAVRFTDITDGTSNTLMFIETLKGNGGKKAVTVNRQHVRLGKKALKGIKEDAGVKDFKANTHIAGDRGASWMDGRFLQATMNGMLKVNDVRPDVDCSGDGGVSAARTMSGVVQVGLCDGSVRSVSTAITSDTWKGACTRAGGEVLGTDW